MSTDRILVGEFDVHIKGGHLDCSVPARFFQNYQREHSVWGEVAPGSLQWLGGIEAELSAPDRFVSFPALLGGLSGTTVNGRLSFSAEITPLRQPIEGAPVSDLAIVTFALLNSPVTGNRVPRNQAKSFRFSCGQFDISVGELTDAHREIAKTVGPLPHTLSNSGTIRDSNGATFSST